MRHRKLRHRLSLGIKKRKALLSNLCIALIERQKIRTTLARGKALRRAFDRLITRIKNQDLLQNKIRTAMSLLNHNSMNAVKKIAVWTPKTRTSGFTSVRRIRHRVNDAADMCIVKWIE